MNRLIWGIVIVVLGILSLIGSGANPQGPAGSIIFGLLCLAGGGLMIYFGARYLNQRKIIIGFALQMLHADNKIVASELAQRLGINEINVRQYLSRAQMKGMIPFKADIV